MTYETLIGEMMSSAHLSSVVQCELICICKVKVKV